AHYCNWLSEQEGIPPNEWCYDVNADRKFAEGMNMAPNYLHRTGYRLPTEAEWEYACRAGTTTVRSYGEQNELPHRYAWYIDNSANRSWPVASLKPNDWGLFDMHGSMWTWCQERYKPYPTPRDGKAIDDTEDDLLILDKELRAVRGGSFAESSPDVRSAH